MSNSNPLFDGIPPSRLNGRGQNGRCHREPAPVGTPHSFTERLSQSNPARDAYIVFILVLSAWLFFGVEPLHAAIARVGTPADLGNNSGTGTLHMQYLVNAGANFLVCGVWGDTPAGGHDDLYTPVWDAGGTAQSMTLAAKNITGTIDRYAYVFVLQNPVTGTRYLDIASAVNHYIGALCATYSGVNGGLGSVVAAHPAWSGSGPYTNSQALTVGSASSWVFAMIEDYNGGQLTAGTGSYYLAHAVQYGLAGILDSNGAVSAGPYTIGWSWPLGPPSQAQDSVVLIEIKATSDGAARRRQGSVL